MNNEGMMNLFNTDNNLNNTFDFSQNWSNDKFINVDEDDEIIIGAKKDNDSDDEIIIGSKKDNDSDDEIIIGAKADDDSDFLFDNSFDDEVDDNNALNILGSNVDKDEDIDIDGSSTELDSFFDVFIMVLRMRII